MTEVVAPDIYIDLTGNIKLMLEYFYVNQERVFLEFSYDQKENSRFDLYVSFFKTVNHYTNWFGIIQFSGFLFAPIVGYVMDWKPKKKQNEKTDIGFIFGFLLTSCVTLVLNILVLVPSLSLQVLQLIQIYYRGLL